MRAVLQTQKTLHPSLLFERKPGPVVHSTSVPLDKPVFRCGGIPNAYNRMVRDQSDSHFKFTMSGVRILSSPF